MSSQPSLFGKGGCSCDTSCLEQALYCSFLRPKGRGVYLCIPRAFQPLKTLSVRCDYGRRIDSGGALSPSQRGASVSPIRHRFGAVSAALWVKSRTVQAEGQPDTLGHQKAHGFGIPGQHRRGETRHFGYGCCPKKGGFFTTIKGDFFTTHM